AEPSSLADNALAVEFGVSPMTVRQAVQQLVTEGLLIRQRGKGTIVAPRPLRGSPQVMERLLEDWRLQGRDCRADILDRKLVAADARVAAVLGVQAGEHIAFVRRLRFVDGSPIALDNRYLSAELCEHFTNRDLAEKPIFMLLREKLHLPVTQATFTIRAAMADEYQARLLQIRRGAPILDREVDVTGADGVVFMTGNSLYHPDRFIFVATAPLDEAASGEA
ncbi:MAG: GntR family transcriptional regulator, partial [Vulcanimicrobiaceae bacterium]